MFRPTLISSLLAASVSHGGVCIENATDRGWHLVAHADDGPRLGGDVAPGGRICSPGEAAGTVAVFATRDDLEGCSRRVPPGATERLLDFPAVDGCLWLRAD